MLPMGNPFSVKVFSVIEGMHYFPGLVIEFTLLGQAFLCSVYVILKKKKPEPVKLYLLK